MGRAPRTKETLPDFLKWRRVTRPPLVFRGLTGSQRTPGFWGVTMDVGMEIKILNPTGMGMMMGMVIEIINGDEDRKSKILPKSDLDRIFTP